MVVVGSGCMVGRIWLLGLISVGGTLSMLRVQVSDASLCQCSEFKSLTLHFVTNIFTNHISNIIFNNQSDMDVRKLTKTGKTAKYVTFGVRTL